MLFHGHSKAIQETRHLLGMVDLRGLRMFLDAKGPESRVADQRVGWPQHNDRGYCAGPCCQAMQFAGISGVAGDWPGRWRRFPAVG